MMDAPDCDRCGGMTTPVHSFDIGAGFSCVMCGNYVDRVVIENRTGINDRKINAFGKLIHEGNRVTSAWESKKKSKIPASTIRSRLAREREKQ
jgi:hypothetical protein